MTSRRMIDPSLWSNAEFHTLDPADQVLTIGMINAADDLGRGPANGRWVRNQILQYSEERASVIETRLRRISETLANPRQFPGRLHVYEVGGSAYFCWLDWHMWQALERPEDDGYPAPPGYEWVPDESDKRRKRAGRWEPISTRTATTPDASADLAPETSSRVPPREEEQSAVSADRVEPAQPEETPPGLRQLAQCHEQHAGRMLSTDDHLKLRAILADAADAGVEWQALLTVMRQAQETYLPSRTAPKIKSIGYYLRDWEAHIRGAKVQGVHTSRASPRQDDSGDDELPPEDYIDERTARVRAQTAELARAAGHVS